MKPISLDQAAISQSTPGHLALSGSWTAFGLGAGADGLVQVQVAPRSPVLADGAGIEALDSAGAWVLQTLLLRLQGEGAIVTVQGLKPDFVRLLAAVAEQLASQGRAPPAAPMRAPALLERIGQASVDIGAQGIALLAFIGESACALAACGVHPSRFRWRPVLFNVRTAGFDALPIVGLLSFLLGVVVAYQGADQLRLYGANLYVADLVGLSMLREFAPLITAIIVAGRSGSAYAAQIGTMAVTEELDAMRTIGIAPIELLVLPKLIALAIVMPLLTVFADALGVFGGMVMAQAQLGVGFADFFDRFAKAIGLSSFLVGIGKAPVFALAIATIGCFQGFRTSGGADSVGRQTTRSVVQSIFLVVVIDGMFSVFFSLLKL